MLIILITSFDKFIFKIVELRCENFFFSILTSYFTVRDGKN